MCIRDRSLYRYWWWEYILSKRRRKCFKIMSSYWRSLRKHLITRSYNKRHFCQAICGLLYPQFGNIKKLMTLLWLNLLSYVPFLRGCQWKSMCRMTVCGHPVLYSNSRRTHFFLTYCRQMQSTMFIAHICIMQNKQHESNNWAAVLVRVHAMRQ